MKSFILDFKAKRQKLVICNPQKIHGRFPFQRSISKRHFNIMLLHVFNYSGEHTITGPHFVVLIDCGEKDHLGEKNLFKRCSAAQCYQQSILIVFGFPNSDGVKKSVQVNRHWQSAKVTVPE